MTRSVVVEVPATVMYNIEKTLEQNTLPLIRDLSGNSASQLIEDMPNQKLKWKAAKSGVNVTYTENFRALGEDKTEITIDVESGLMMGKTIANMVIAMAISTYKAIESGYTSGMKYGKHGVSNNCKKCGKELNPEFMACPFCGTPR